MQVLHEQQAWDQERWVRLSFVTQMGSENASLIIIIIIEASFATMKVISVLNAWVFGGLEC